MLILTEEPSSQTVEIIKAIGSLWPILIVLIVTILFLVYRRQIGSFLQRTSKVSGKTSLIEFNYEKSDENLDFPTSEIQAEEKTNESSIAVEQADSIIGLYAIYKLLTEKKIDEAEAAFSKMQSNETDTTEREKNHFFFLSLKFSQGGINTTAEIEKKLQTVYDPEIKRVGTNTLGACYLKEKEYTLAIETYHKAYFLSQTEEQKGIAAIKVASCLIDSGNKNEAIEYLLSIKKEFSDKKVIAELFSKLAQVYDDENSWIERCLATELAIANDPSNTSYLFDAGYAYSNSYRIGDQMTLLSLLHYKDLTEYNEKSEAGHNNLGVAYSVLDLKHKAVKSYKRGVELNHSLAASNLANKYIQEGFLDEAKELLDKVKSNANVHENVWSSLNTIGGEIRKEQEQETEMLAQAKKLQLFLRDYAQLYFSKSIIENPPSSFVLVFNGEKVELKALSNPEYRELDWSDNLNNYKLTIKLTTEKAIYCNGSYSKKGRSIYTNTLAFVINENENFRIMLYDKDSNIPFQFEMKKSSLS
jgi:tetratricopeptide (TPR) repeat protein